MKLPWKKKRDGQVDARKRLEQEELLESAKLLTPAFERAAKSLARLPEEELVARLRLAMTRRTTA